MSEQQGDATTTPAVVQAEPPPQHQQNGDIAATVQPTPAPVTAQAVVLEKPTSADEEKGLLEDEETPPPPVVRMRNQANTTTTTMNGQNNNDDLQQATLNGHSAVARGLELLASVETSEANEEIKKLDSQLDHFNKYLDKFEKKNTELTERLNTMLQTQKEERVKRRASFMQREEELKTEQESFDSQMRNMFAKCAHMRRQTAPIIETSNGIVENGGRQRILDAGNHQAPIHEANGHEEATAAGAGAN